MILTSLAFLIGIPAKIIKKLISIVTLFARTISRFILNAFTKVTVWFVSVYEFSFGNRQPVTQEEATPPISTQEITTAAPGLAENPSKKPEAEPSPYAGISQVQPAQTADDQDRDKSLARTMAINPEIRKLVCTRCWDTIFSETTFTTIWMTASLNSHSTKSQSNDAHCFTFRTPTWAQMQESIDHMCEWCDIVCEDIEVYYQHRKKTKQPPPDDSTFSITIRFMWSTSDAALLFRLCVENDWYRTWYVYADADNVAARCIAARGLVWDVNSSQAYKLIRKCMEDCSHHKHCPRPQPSKLPRRVIDCADPTHPRLVESESLGEERYAALSYVWGQEQPHSTKEATIEPYKHSIDRRLIPKTILDAITVTSQLGLRYLWVDSFCIIQDSDEDKNCEIPKIRHTFQHAHVTIVAADAQKVSDGFLHNRKKWPFAVSTLPFRCPDKSIGTLFLSHGDEGRPTNEPVDARAWCLEERVLSPRKLIYCRHGLQYECQSTRMNANGSPGYLPDAMKVPRLPDCSMVPQIVPRASEEDIERSWRFMVSLYTQRALTKPKDRLVALSGVVDHFHDLWPQSKYVAGLWTHQFPQALLWAKRTNREYRRPEKYRAPSWSWAAVDGEVSWLHESREGVVSEVKDWSVKLKSPKSVYGEVTGGFLLLSAIVKPVIWNPEESELFETTGGGDRALSSHEESMNGEMGYVVADAVEPASDTLREVFAAVLKDTGSTLLGIILEPTWDDDKGRHGSMSVYRRIGWFTAPFCERAEWLSTEYQVIKII